ncbi:MAG TPA: hypothetical protein VFQ32_08655 [Ktedonobacterales bacterium]|nr:hypothetical protein [Ktedonobacterales bacterium]
MDGPRFRRIITTRMAGGVLLLLTLGMLAGCAVPLPWVPAYSSSSSSIRSMPGPMSFEWNRVTPAPPTPQQAYAAGMSVLNICGNRPPANEATTTLTWLVAGPAYGVVLARATCSQDGGGVREGIALLPLALDKRVQPRCPAWDIEGGLIGGMLPADAKLGQMAFRIPSWLPLPQDTYMSEPLGDGDIMPSSLLLLESSTRLFVAGRYAGSATRPAGSETVNVAGRSGWQARENGIVTVTVPLADGWTYFFAGTADAATMQRLANAALPHLDTLLPTPVGPTPTDYPQPTPAC